MIAGFFFRGAAIGFSIAAPVGPIGILCIRRSVSGGRLLGFATGLGSATADAVYGTVAGFGLTTISGFLVGERFWLQLLGGAFLCYLGVRIGREHPRAEAGAVSGRGLLGAYASTFFLTLTNPATILAFVAVFASLGLAGAPSYRAAATLVGGVFLGSMLWWTILSQVAGTWRSRLTPGMLRGINRLSGAVLGAFGLIAIYLALRR
jgi:threonine/homoserine/homoserine lactone efflux protein